MSYKDGSLKTVDRRIFNGMSRMWEKTFYGMQMMIQKCECLFLRTSLICDFCPSDRSFAYSFLQIPSHDGHLTVQLYTSHYLGVFGTFTR